MSLKSHQQNGFTLIEIAVVLVIVGLLVGSFIGTFVSRIDTTRRDSTKDELQEIKQVLMAFAFSRGPQAYLPCRDITVPPDGVEDRDLATGNCIPPPGGVLGTLPWQTLGMGREDAWASHYRYWVNDDYASAAGFNLGSDDNGGANAEVHTRINNVDSVMVNNAVAVIFSHGKNSLGSVSVEGDDRAAVPAAGYDDENENTDGDVIFMSRPPSEEGSAAAGGVFDDILIWINSYELKAKMIEAGISL